MEKSTLTSAKKTFCVVLLAMLSTITATAYDFEKDGIYYEKIPGTKHVKVTYKEANKATYSGDINIPSKVISAAMIPYTVTEIGDSAFYYCSGVTSVIIPNTVNTIGDYALSGCTSLTSVTIPNSVTTIGDFAFYQCSSLTSVNIPKYVTTIGNHAFFGCSSLTSATIPNSVTTIGDYAFCGCSSLTGVTLPNSVNTIGENAFCECSSLTSINIPNSVTTIGEGAFVECSSLTSINIPNSVTTIGGNAFAGCKSLTGVTIPNSVTTIRYCTFQRCLALASVTIPNSVTSIDYGAFYKCFALTSINIPNSVNTIGEDAFRSCSALTSITIPNSVTSIGDYAFEGCSKLTTLHLPSSLTHLGRNPFTQCPALQTFTGKYASSDGRCLIHNGNLAAFAPAGLTSYTIPNSATTIGNHAFHGCSSLASITIPNSVTTIGYYAFEGCSKLTTLHLPSSLDEICANAFKACYAITEIYSKMKWPQTVKYGIDIFDPSIYDKATMYVPYPYGFNYITTPFASIKNYKHIDYTRDLNGDNTINAADIETMVGSILNKPTQLTHEGETHTAVDLGLSVMWSMTNVGSDTPFDPGNYYGWGECTPKSNFYISNYLDIMGGEFTSSDEFGTTKDPMKNYVYPNTKSISGTQFDAAQARWGGNWRMPTIAEWEELINQCSWEWQNTSLFGTPIKGYVVTGPNGYGIFLPVTGYMLDSNLRDEEKGFYWTDKSNSAGTHACTAVTFGAGTINVEAWLRPLGGVIRPVLDSPFDLNNDHQINSADINVVINAVLNK